MSVYQKKKANNHVPFKSVINGVMIINYSYQKND